MGIYQALTTGLAAPTNVINKISHINIALDSCWHHYLRLYAVGHLHGPTKGLAIPSLTVLFNGEQDPLKYSPTIQYKQM